MSRLWQEESGWLPVLRVLRCAPNRPCDWPRSHAGGRWFDPSRAHSHPGNHAVSAWLSQSQWSRRVSKAHGVLSWCCLRSTPPLTTRQDRQSILRLPRRHPLASASRARVPAASYGRKGVHASPDSVLYSLPPRSRAAWSRGFPAGRCETGCDQVRSVDRSTPRRSEPRARSSCPPTQPLTRVGACARKRRACFDRALVYERQPVSTRSLSPRRIPSASGPRWGRARMDSATPKTGAAWHPWRLPRRGLPDLRTSRCIRPMAFVAVAS